MEKKLFDILEERGYVKDLTNEKDIKFFFKDFDIEYLNEEIMTRYKLEKRLYRVCLEKSKRYGNSHSRIYAGV